MKTYQSAESQSLKFHNAFYKVISPIFILVQVLLFISTIGHLKDKNSFYGSEILIISLVISGLSIIFLGLITYGFAKKNAYAWYIVYAYLGLTILSNIISAVQSVNVASAVGQIVGSLIIPISIGIYYYKRKSILVTPNIENLNDSEETTIRYCRKCGNQVSKDSVFCNKCGSKIHWD